MSMDNERFRKLLIRALDDNKGVNESAYALLYEMACERDYGNVLKYVDATDGRFYLPENHPFKGKD